MNSDWLIHFSAELTLVHGKTISKWRAAFAWLRFLLLVIICQLWKTLTYLCINFLLRVKRKLLCLSGKGQKSAFLIVFAVCGNKVNILENQCLSTSLLKFRSTKAYLIDSNSRTLVCWKFRSLRVELESLTKFGSFFTF